MFMVQKNVYAYVYGTASKERFTKDVHLVHIYTNPIRNQRRRNAWTHPTSTAPQDLMFADAPRNTY